MFSSFAMDTSKENDGVEDTVIIDPYTEVETVESVSAEELRSFKPGDLAFDDLQKLSVDVNALPEFINVDTAVAKGHVNRLYLQESSLNTVIYQNRNGTKSTYIFSKPVKYVDETGKVQDKSSKLSRLSDGVYPYAMLNNSVKAYFSGNAANGTMIRYKDYSISMSPDTLESSSVTFKPENNTIEYSGAFGSGTSIVYQPKLNGLKEDIVLLEKPENNEFGFNLVLEGLTPIKHGEQWYLADENNNIISNFGEIIIRDATGRTVDGNIIIVGTDSQGVYKVVISAPSLFLDDDATSYPVFIDPSIYIWEDGYYYNEYEATIQYNAITDTGLYTTSAAVSTAQSNPDYHKLGYYSSANGKIIYKLYDFFGEYGQYKDLLDCQIGIAHLYFQVNSGTAATVTVNPMTSTWNTGTYGDNPVALCNSSLWSSYSSNYASSLSLDSTSGERAIDITNILRGWARYNAGTSTASYDNPSNGFVLSSNATTSYRNITAVEEFYADSVYVLMDTSYIGGSYYINNILSGQFLRRNSASTLTTSKYANTNNIRWFFEYIGNDKYIIRSMYNTSYALYGSGTSVSLSYLPNNPTDNYIWDVSNAASGGVIIKNKSNDKVLRYNGSTLSLITAMTSSNPNYMQTVWGIVAQNNYVNLTSFTVTKPEWLAIGMSQYVTIVATPSNATWKGASNFTWSSNNNSIATVSSDGKITGVSAGTAQITANHKMTNCTYSFNVSVKIYGSKLFRTLPSSMYTDINCHGYAMFRNDIPSGWTNSVSTYLQSIQPTSIIGNNDYSSTIRHQVSEHTKNDFEAWLTNNGYTYQIDSTFSNNGQNRVLQSNQYRVVLRTGFHNFPINIIGTTIIYGPCYDYHFWYQTYDGTWANKHGHTDFSAPEHLPNGITPESVATTGWELCILDNEGNTMYTHNNFYDGDIYVYIITVS